MVTDKRMVKRSTALFRLLPTDGGGDDRKCPAEPAEGNVAQFFL